MKNMNGDTTTYRPVRFTLPGNGAIKHKENSRLFLTSESRVRHGGRINFNNDTSTYVTFPGKFFKENFKYCRTTGIYRTELTYKDVHKFMTVEEFTSKGHIQIYPS